MGTRLTNTRRHSEQEAERREVSTIHTSVTHSFGIDHDKVDSITGTQPLARGYCYPGGDWFSLALGRSKEDVHIKWEEWDRIVHCVQSLRDTSRLEVVMKQKGTP